eukprot:4934260-Alexandrium_andersonii.AAC.1
MARPGWAQTRLLNIHRPMLVLRKEMTPARCEARQPDNTTVQLVPFPALLPCPWVPAVSYTHLTLPTICSV